MFRTKKLGIAVTLGPSASICTSNRKVKVRARRLVMCKLSDKKSFVERSGPSRSVLGLDNTVKLVIKA